MNMLGMNLSLENGDVVDGEYIEKIGAGVVAAVGGTVAVPAIAVAGISVGVVALANWGLNAMANILQMVKKALRNGHQMVCWILVKK
ncbi:MAG: hypothetical protein ACI4RF_08125 [Eubacterium sp.]